MIVTIRYGDEKLKLNLPDTVNFNEYKYMPRDKAVNIEQFGGLMETAENELFPVLEADLCIVNDAYRPTPTAAILEWLDSRTIKIKEN